MAGDNDSVKDKKLGDIRRAFTPLIGATLSAYSTAELLHDDGTWGAWPDLPIRLEWGTRRLVSVSWSRFDDLWISADTSLPVSIDGSTVRWVPNASPSVDRVVGGALLSVALGRGEMSIGEREFEIWTRLLLQTDKGWLEIFNALDENGYAYHSKRPDGQLEPCI
jgi:hypothetical protein